MQGQTMTNHLYKGDLPDDLDLGPVVAIDCETMGLNPHRDRLCVVQMSGGDGNAHLVQVAKGQTEAPNLVRAADRSGGSEALPFRPLRHRGAAARLRGGDGAGLLHQDRQSRWSAPIPTGTG